MPRPADRLPTNVPGDWYVDRSCINCGTCRRIAPATFAERPVTPASAEPPRKRSTARAPASEPPCTLQSPVVAQPRDAASVLRAGMALLACPVGAIGAPSRTDLREARDTFPEPAGDGVRDVGYACRSTGGAAAWLLIRAEGNVLVDVPRYAKPLLAQVEALGGVRTLVVTHPAGLGAHGAWARHFKAERVVHADVALPPPPPRVRPAPPPERIEQRVASPTRLGSDLLVLPTLPGCLAVAWREEVLCAGTLLSADDAGRLRAAPAGGLGDALAVLRHLRFSRVLPAHGTPWTGDGAAALTDLCSVPA